MSDDDAPKPGRIADVRDEVPGNPTSDDDLSGLRPTYQILHGPQAKKWDPTPLLPAVGFQIRLKAVEEFIVNAGPTLLILVGLVFVAAGLITAHDVVWIVGLLVGGGGGVAEVTRRRRR